jgi:D-alanyl-D-alanine carboxypeptidase
LNPISQASRLRIEALLRDLGIAPDHPRLARLEAFAEAAELVEVARDGEGRALRLAPAAAEAWQRLASAATREGVGLTLISGFRSYAHQRDLVRRKLAAGEPLEDVLRVLAPPGYSEHHTGCAVDVGSPGAEVLGPGFARSPAFVWLAEHGPRQRWRLSYPAGNVSGYIYEPWHWRFLAP